MISGAGAGDLIFTDAQVNGTLCIDRLVFANNPFVVGNTGILKLFHTITPGNKISNYGTLAVDAGDTATILGDYTQAGNGKIQVDAVSASSYGKVRVTGTADLSANNLINVNVTAHDTLAVNDALNAVLSANTLVVDQNRFEVEDNSAMWKFIPTFDNDMIDLTVLRQLTCAQAVNDSSQVSNPVAAGAAGVLDDLVVSGTVTPDMQAVLDEMGALQTGEQVAEAVAQTVPVLASASPQIGFDLAANGATQVVQNRLGGFSGMSAGDPVFEDQFVWVKPFYARTDQDKWNGIDGYKANAYGLAIGADGKINPEWRMGAAVSYGTADVQSDSIITQQQLDVETWQATLYANGDLGKYFTLNLVGALGFNQNDSSRNIVFGGLGRTALAEYDSLHTLVDAELVKTYAINDNLTLGASLGLDYIYICVDDYTETGAGALNLKVQGVNADTLVASIGGRLEYSITQNQRLTGQISLGYDLLADGSSLVSTYTGGGPSFVVTGNSPDEKVYQGGLGYELTCFRGMELLARYRVESRKHFFNQTGSINFRFPF
ncbi:MAG: autotransporter outer membrane beta-barrel domain-containing protein [Desulfobacter sp.]|nr:autotransporter outer membrane beta-barrel domain-containing protein [Desulfobacter sp.]